MLPDVKTTRAQIYSQDSVDRLFIMQIYCNRLRYVGKRTVATKSMSFADFSHIQMSKATWSTKGYTFQKPYIRKETALGQPAWILCQQSVASKELLTRDSQSELGI